MKDEELTDNKSLNFSDLSDEQNRIYVFPDNQYVRIEQPLALNVSASGGHRIYALDGNSYYIPSGWICLSWRVKEGKKPFTF